MTKNTGLLTDTPTHSAERFHGLSPFDRVTALVRFNTLNAQGVTYVLGLPMPDELLLAKGDADAPLAVLMLSAALAQLGMKSYYDRLHQRGSRDRTPSQRQGMTAARSMVRKLRETGMDFVMVWRVNGLSGFHLDYSANLDRDLLEKGVISVVRLFMQLDVL